jgi:hypothetical protein
LGSLVAKCTSSTSAASWSAEAFGMYQDLMVMSPAGDDFAAFGGVTGTGT